MGLSVKVFCIPRDQIIDYWPRVEAWIDASYAKVGAPTPPHQDIAMMDGHAQLWIAWGSEGKILCGVVTRLAKMRSELHCQLVAAGGVESQRWIGAMLATVQEWAKLEGCSKVTAQGRPGWAKLLRDYRISQVVLELDL
jgi:hypothetical protein